MGKRGLYRNIQADWYQKGIRKFGYRGIKTKKARLWVLKNTRRTYRKYK